ncbi:hypothetical protein H0H92_007125 [Tricholoma furcatifolium]|nr:hypothetical protein H0H92_007125 [Tricholoma furcatifolium]
MSNGLPNSQTLFPSNQTTLFVKVTEVNEETYRQNLQQVELLQSQIDQFKAWNEDAHAEWKQRELLRKIEEGKEAERQLYASLKPPPGNRLAIAGPSVSNPQSSYTAVPMNGNVQHNITYAQPTYSNWEQYGTYSMASNIQQYQKPALQQQNNLTWTPVTGSGNAQIPQQQHLPSFFGQSSLPSGKQQVHGTRQPLDMQPVHPAHSAHSNQQQQQTSEHSHLNQSRHAPPPDSTHTGAPPPPVNSHQHQNQPAKSYYREAVPKKVASRKLKGNHPQSSTSSSLVHALGSVTSAQPLPSSTGIPPTSDSDLGATAKQIHEHLTANHSTTSAPSTTPVSSVPGSVSSLMPGDARLNPKAVAAWQQFLEAVAIWARSSPPSSHMQMPSNTHVRVLKASNGEVSIIIPDQSGPKAVSLEKLKSEIDHHAALLSGIQHTGVPPRVESGTDPSKASASAGPQAAQSSTNQPGKSDVGRPAANGVLPPTTPQKSTLSTSSTLRTPSQADKKSLAKDLLRALVPAKRSKPDEPSSEPPAKRQAIVPPASVGTVTSSIAEPSIPTSSTNAVIVAPTPSLPGSGPRPVEPDVSSVPESSSVGLPEAGASASSLNEPPMDRLPAVQSSTSSLVEVPMDSLPAGSLVSSPRQSLHEETSEEVSTTTKTPEPQRDEVPLFLPSPSPAAESSASGSTTRADVSRSLKRNRLMSHVLISPPLWFRQYKAQLEKNGRETSMSAVDSSDEIDPFSSNTAELIGDEEIDVIDLDPANQFANGWITLFVVGKIAGDTRFTGLNSFGISKGMQLYPYDVHMKEMFRTPRQLARHHEAEHRNHRLKPSAAPYSPTLETPAEPPLLEMPCYQMDTIQTPSISKQQHESLLPWVLGQIMGPTNRKVKRYNAAAKLPLRSQFPSGVGHHQTYEFLNFPSTNYSSVPSQPAKTRSIKALDSIEVSEMIEDGWVLWGPSKLKKEEITEDQPHDVKEEKRSDSGLEGRIPSSEGEAEDELLRKSPTPLQSSPLDEGGIEVQIEGRHLEQV